MILLGGESSGTNYPQVQNYDALPLASEQTGGIYIVQEPQGTWLINRKRAGLYRSDGETWTRLGVVPTCEEIGADPAGSSATVQGNLNTHTTEESNPHSVTAEQVGAIKYVDRGDPASWDFTINDLTADQTWRDLDLSDIVPDDVELIHLRVRLRVPSLAAIYFRKKGNAGGINTIVAKVQVANVYYDGGGFVVCDPDKIVQYLASNVPWTVIDIAVRGWFEA